MLETLVWICLPAQRPPLEAGGAVRWCPTCICIQLPPGMEAQVRPPQSGLALKHHITVLNSQGSIDEGYRGEIGAILNQSQPTGLSRVEVGMKIAQMVIQPVTFKSKSKLASELDIAPEERKVLAQQVFSLPS